MKKLLIILLVLPSLCNAQVLFFTFQAGDLAKGLKYEQHMGGIGLYGAVAHGKYPLPGEVIKNHIKSSIGIVKLTPNRGNSLSVGIVHHNFWPVDSERDYGKSLNPVSVEFGVTIYTKRIALGLRVDTKHHVAIDFGPVLDWKKKYKRAICTAGS